MGIIGCLLGFLIVIIFCYKDWSVYIATIVGAAVVMLFNWLPFIDTLTGAFVDGMFVPIRSFFFILLFLLIFCGRTGNAAGPVVPTNCSQSPPCRGLSGRSSLPIRANRMQTSTKIHSVRKMWLPTQDIT